MNIGLIIATYTSASSENMAKVWSCTSVDSEIICLKGGRDH